MYPSLKILIRQKSVLFDKLWFVMRVIFLIIQKNEAENVSMMLNELFLAFQINFHPHKYFYDLEFPLLKKCMTN